MKVFVKRLILAILLLALLLPAGQAKFNWIDTGLLEGYFEPPAPHPELTWQSLTSNQFQPALERYLDDRLGFRVWSIKLRNQLPYSLFHETNDPNRFVGVDNQLFEVLPLNAYIGLDSVDASTVQRHIRRLRVVQDTLARRGKLLVFIATPSKASFAPENMPAYFRNYPRRHSNYEKYTAAMRTAGINLLDLSQAVRQWKDTASYPLFPRYGTHWSNYTAALAGDTIMRYVAQKYGHPLRTYHLLPGEITDVPRDNDNDVGMPLNLWWPLEPYNMKYPKVEYDVQKPDQRRPTALIIGDSFVFSVLYSYFSQSFDDKLSRFWFYNPYNEVITWPGELPEGRDMKVIDRKVQYLARDIVLVMFTEYNMNKKLDYGFSDDAYRLLVPYNHADSLRVRALELQIRQKPGMDDYWWKKSSETGLGLEQLVHQKAIAQYDSLR